MNSFIKFSLRFLATLLFVSSPSYAEHHQISDSSPEYTGVYFKRPAMVVTDLDRATHLWRDILGMKLHKVGEEDSDSLVYSLFNLPPNAKARFASFDAGNQIRSLGILEVKDIELTPPTGVRRVGVVINVNGRWQKIKAELQRLGLELLREKKLVTNDQGSGIESGFVDWDGNLVIVYQLENAKLPD